MNMDIKYQIKVGEAAVQIVSIFNGANPDHQNVSDIADTMMDCITAVQLNFGKRWEDVEADILKDILAMPHLSDALRGVIEITLQRQAVDFTSISGDNIH